MKTVLVNLGDRSYPIYIGEGLLANAELYQQNIQGKQVMVVTNETIAPLYLDKVMTVLNGYQSESLIIPDGEKYKTLQTMETIITALLENKFSRNGTLIALGGGVIGDITGFAAACYQRGIKFIQVPTTLLAQVDSSVGGKTAVNHKLGKNMIGAFHQPNAVIADTAVLKSLHDREYKAGLAEVIKYGLIRDKEFFNWLETNLDILLQREPEALSYAIEVSCKNKAAVVAEDEKESGIRAILNLGHTFGHAIETGLDYKGWLHGEAVAVGMLMAADLSKRHGWLEQSDLERVRAMLAKVQLPVELPAQINSDVMLRHMAVDKKARDGKLFLVLLDSIGHAVVTSEFDSDLLSQTINSFAAS